MLSVIVSMFVFLLVAAITPGPVNIIATSSGATYGFARTLPHVTGASTAYCLICLLAGMGLSGLLLAYPVFLMGLKYLGGGFLLYMAWRIARARPMSHQENDPAARPPRFLEGFLTQGLNPKAWLAALSGASLYVAAREPSETYLIIYVGLAFAICFFSIASWAGMGRMLQGMLTNARRSAIFNSVMGGLLTVTVIMMLVGN